MLVPLYGFVKGDSLGVVVLVHDFHSVRELGDRLQRAAAPRVRPRASVSIWSRGRALDPAATVAEVGLLALDRVDLVPEGVGNGAP